MTNDKDVDQCHDLVRVAPAGITDLAVQRDEQESRAARDAYPGLSFTPDSREVVAFWGGRIWRVPVDGGDPIEIPFAVKVRG